MAIELPPPLPPQAVPADELRTVANARTIEFKTYRVHLPANGGLDAAQVRRAIAGRSEEHTSELQSLMRISYAVFCLKKKNKSTTISTTHNIKSARTNSIHNDSRQDPQSKQSAD